MILLRYFTIPLVLAIGLTSCELIEPFIFPEDPVEEGFELVGSQRIDQTGGSIVLDSIEITVSPGAFAKTTKIQVYQKNDDQSFGSNTASKRYLVKGLPDDLSTPLTILIKPNGILSGDTLVAIGELGYSTSIQTSLFAYQVQSAIGKQDWIEFMYPFSASVPTKAQAHLNQPITSDQFMFVLLNRYTHFNSKNDHFTILSPISVLVDGIKLGNYFEAAYDTCQKMGFDLSVRTWPAPVLIQPLSEFIGYYTHFAPPKKSFNDSELMQRLNLGRFTMNETYLSNSTEMKVTAGHEFFHLVQNIYEFSSPWIMPEQEWLREATSTWFEGKFSPDPFYISSVIPGRMDYIFNGLQKDSAAHGYGVSYIIKDLAWAYGDQSILKIFESIKKGVLPGQPTNPIDAILNQLNEPVGQFWHGVIGSYVLGNYYNKKVALPLLKEYTLPGMLEGHLNLSNPVDNRTGTWLYNLDAMILMYDFSGSDWKEDTRIRISVSDPTNLGIMVFKFKIDQEITKLAEDFPGEDGTIMISNLKTIKDQGYYLGVLLTNARTTPDYYAQLVFDYKYELNPTSDPGTDNEILMPDAVNLSYWDALRLTTIDKSRDNLFYVKIKCERKFWPMYWNKNSGGFWDSWDNWQFNTPDSFPITGRMMENILGNDFKPDSQDSLKVRFGQGTEYATVKSIPLSIDPLFGGIHLVDSVGSGMTPSVYSWECGESGLNMIAGGNQFTGEFSKNNYYCLDASGKPKDTSRTYSWSSNLSIDAVKDQLSGNGSSNNSMRVKDRDNNKYDNNWDEILITSTYSFSSPLTFSKVSKGDNFGLGLYQMAFGVENISGISRIRKVLYRYNKPDSIWTEEQAFSGETDWINMVGTLK